ncbi:MAG: MarR family winged helix-turn-helix transcriptional regulator [Solirubrobacteraceae bacterium]
MPPIEQPALILHPGMASRYTGYLIGRLGLFAARRFDAQLAVVGLTTRRWAVLNALDSEGPATQQHLGRAISIDPSTMVATIDELERDGLVERRPHPSDRRAHAVQLTDPGREILARARRLAGEAQQELMAPLNDSERATLHELLLKVAQGATRLPPAGAGPEGGRPAGGRPEGGRPEGGRPISR